MRHLLSSPQQLFDRTTNQLKANNKSNTIIFIMYANTLFLAALVPALAVLAQESP